MPRALGLVLACKLAASVISMRTDSLPRAPTVAVLVEAISGTPDTLLTVRLPRKLQTSTQMTAPKPGRRSCNNEHHNKLAINQKEKKKDQKKQQHQQHYGIYLYELLRHSLPGPNNS
jgi:hypothetical protein